MTKLLFLFPVLFFFFLTACTHSLSSGAPDLIALQSQAAPLTHTPVEEVKDKAVEEDDTDSPAGEETESAAEKQIQVELDALPAAEMKEVNALFSESISTQNFITATAALGLPNENPQDPCQTFQKLRKKSCMLAARYCGKAKSLHALAKCKKLTKACYKWIQKEDRVCVCQLKEE